MRNISDTIRRLRAQNLAVLPGGIDAGPDRLSDLPDFGSNPGQLRARTYIPQDLGADAPLVVVLHGCTQTAAAYDHGSGWSRLADQHGFALLFPQQQRSNNPNLCFNWFVPGDIGRDAGEALSIRQMVEATVKAHGIDTRRIYVTGLSAGGAMASVMLAAYPEIFAGGAIIAGLPYRCAATIPEAFDRMRGHGMPAQGELGAVVRAASGYDGPWPTISIWQGSADRTVHPSNADAIAGQWRALHRLPKAPTRSDSVNGHPRQVWCNATGREVIELRTINGMGHGTPIATTGAGQGASGPFMLDVGISSTFQIARAWKLVTDKTRAQPIRPKAQASAASPAARAAPKPPAIPAMASAEAAPPAPARAGGIGKIIEDALRKAGLMRN